MFTPTGLDQIREVVMQCLQRAQSPWMDANEAAAYAGCSPRTIGNAADAGHIKRNKPTDTAMVRYHRDELDKWIEGRK